MLVPPGVVAVTVAAPAAPAGAVAVIEVAEVTVTPVAGVVPNFTAVAPVRFVPMMVTTVPPAVGPVDGVIAVNAGAGAVVLVVRVRSPVVAAAAVNVAAACTRYRYVPLVGVNVAAHTPVVSVTPEAIVDQTVAPTAARCTTIARAAAGTPTVVTVTDAAIGTPAGTVAAPVGHPVIVVAAPVTLFTDRIGVLTAFAVAVAGTLTLTTHDPGFGTVYTTVYAPAAVVFPVVTVVHVVAEARRCCTFTVRVTYPVPVLTVIGTDT